MTWSVLYLWRIVLGQEEHVSLLPWDEDERNFYGVPTSTKDPVVYPKTVWHRFVEGSKS